MEKVFVYGSLKRGFPLHSHLASQNFLGEAFTYEDRYELVSLGWFPGLRRDYTGYRVKGELYEVDDDTLGRLDIAEGHPEFFHRERINVFIKDTGTVMTVSAYMYPHKHGEPVPANEHGVKEWL